MRGRKWTEEELNYVKDNYHNKTSDLAKVLSRSFCAVRGIAIKLKLSKSGQPRIKSDGVISLRQDTGKPYYYIRLSIAKWIPLQKHNWEKVNGRIKKNLFLRCIDGNTLNCDESNWELVTRAKNMNLNSVHNYPEEIAAVIQLRGVLNRQINKHKKSINER